MLVLRHDWQAVVLKELGNCLALDASLDAMLNTYSDAHLMQLAPLLGMASISMQKATCSRYAL